MIQRGLCLLLAAVGLTSTALYGQEKPARLTYDVAAIRLSQPEQRDGGIKPLPAGQGYTAKNISVRLMIGLMYKVPMRQIKGGPEWLDSEHYDVEARADRSYSRDDLQVMFQNLLADRLNLKFHKETKEGQVYALMVDKSGPKMKVNESAEDFGIPMNYGNDGVVIGKRVPMRYFCWWLGLQLEKEERPVIDRTGLERNYDFTLAFAPVLPPDVTGANRPSEVMDRPSIFDALKQQLGLKLQAEKGPVEYYVIDHVEKPSAN